MTTTAADDEPDDPNWRFDPDNPPDRFTRRMLGRMSVAHLLLCADHEKSPLNAPQQASFDVAYAELNRDIGKHIDTAMQSVMPKLNFKWPTTDIDFSALVPEIDTAFASNLAYEALSESTKASFERIQRNLTAHLDVAQRIRTPALALEVPRLEPSLPGEPEEPSEPEDSGPVLPPGDTAPTVVPVRDVTPDELLDDLDEDLNQLALFGTMVQLLEEQSTLMRQQGDVVRRQQESAARGLLFYIVVGLGSALSGIATVVGLGDTSDVLLSLGLLAVVAAVAWGAYFRKRGRLEIEEQSP